MKLRILITAGPTVEDLDPVRFISNRATGLLGALTARAGSEQHAITLVHGPLSHDADSIVKRLNPRRVSVVPVRSAAQMHQAVIKHLPRVDVVIMSAAVADFTPAKTSSTKLKKAKTGLTLRLKPTVDILKSVGSLKRSRFKKLKLIGFALETGSGRTPAARAASRTKEALRKLKKKNLDAIVLDTPAAMGAQSAGFTVLFPDQRSFSLECTKVLFAEFLIQLVGILRQ